MNYEIKIAELAETFPTLRDARIRPWDADAFDAWACDQLGSGLQHAARFVLAVWAVDATWRMGRFDAMNALGTWDAEHRSAFLAWANSPWFP
jgi:hypothetical protein